MRKQEDHELKEIFVYIMIGLIMTIIIPIFIGFAFGGFAESFVPGKPLEIGSFLVTFLIYYIMIVAGIIGLPTLKLAQLRFQNHRYSPANQPNAKPSNTVVSYIHDPETLGLFYNLFSGMKQEKVMRWSLSMLRMFVYSTIFFGFVGILQATTKFSFVGIPGMPFQVTPLGEVFFSAEPPAFAETTLMILVFSLLMWVNAYICSKLKLGKIGFFTIGLILVCPVIGLGWMGFHAIVYGNSASGLLATFIFGWIGCTLTLLFGTFIVWYVWHFWNNWFYKLSITATANESLFVYSIIALVLLTIATIVVEVIIHNSKKKNRYIPRVPR